MKTYDNLTEFLSGLQTGAEAFQGYKTSTDHNMMFHTPENQAEEDAVKRVKKERVKVFAPFIIFFGIILIIFLIIDFKNLMGILFTSIIFFPILITTILDYKSQPKVITGVVAFKNPTKPVNRKKNEMYRISVAVEEPEKTIYLRIPIKLADYEACQVGTPVAVVKLASSLKATII